MPAALMTLPHFCVSAAWNFARSAGELVQAVRTPPGLYATEARPIGFGLHMSRPSRNLLLVTFGDRQVATGRVS